MLAVDGWMRVGAGDRVRRPDLAIEAMRDHLGSARLARKILRDLLGGGLGRLARNA
jgi:hypothetical protein